MKVRYFYNLSKIGELWSPMCKIVDDEKYDDNYSAYLAEAVWDMRRVEDVDYVLEGIKKVENDEIECYETGTEISFISVYKDRVDFESSFIDDDDWGNWSCTLEEYKKVLLGKKVFLMLPKELESYIEVNINDL